MHTLTTRINSEEVEVEFTFDKGYDATWDDPGCPDDWEVHKVWYKGVDVLPIMHEEDVEDIYFIVGNNMRKGHDD